MRASGLAPNAVADRVRGSLRASYGEGLRSRRAVTAEVARRLGVPELRLVVNKYAPLLDRDALCRQVEATYGAPVAGMFAHSDEMLALQSGGVFALRYPEHEFSRRVGRMAKGFLSAS